MENASEALIMAGQIVVFLIALTVCISSFTNVRAEVNRIIGETYQIRMAKDGEDYVNFIESRKSSSIRVVTSDTVISSIYRAVKENYVIYLKLKDTSWIDKNYIKTINAKTTSNVKDSSGNAIINENDVLIKITVGTETNQEVDKVLRKKDAPGGGGNLYEKIKDSNFNEYVGEYQDASNVETENKQTYRIVTYVEI